MKQSRKYVIEKKIPGRVLSLLMKPHRPVGIRSESYISKDKSIIAYIEMRRADDFSKVNHTAVVISKDDGEILNETIESGIQNHEIQKGYLQARSLIISKLRTAKH